MKKSMTKTRFIAFTLMLLLFGSMAMICDMPVMAADLPVYETTVSEATSSTIIVGYEGKYITDTKEALARINEIRKEACDEGIINPETGEPLTSADYVPLKWSSSLEKIARIRAAEGSIRPSHTRPNGSAWNTVFMDNMKSNSEDLAWNYSSTTMIGGINQWYGEKYDWVNNTGEETGHYTSMIRPEFKYIAVADFYSSNAPEYPNTVSAEFSRTESGLDETMLNESGACIQKIEVPISCLSDLAIKNIPDNLAAGDTATLTATVSTSLIDAWNKTAKTDNLKVYSGCAWSSLDTDVVTINESGELKGIEIGTAKIQATIGSNDISETVVVKKDNKISMIPDKLQMFYTGQAFALSMENGKDLKWSGTGSIKSITYYLDENGETKTTTENSGATALGEAPVNTGDYYAYVTVAGDEDYVSTSDYIPFTIKKANPDIGIVSYEGGLIDADTNAKTL
ncbi:MAG: CAP domain-containing protein, partial [Lachnospiraceae bacterium]|nr:CAP domain-containing protein [Lachnospiraceae bacterium]